MNQVHISQKQNKFSNRCKLLPVNLTWLHQVYEKMLYLQKHPVVLVLVNVFLNNFIFILIITDVIAIVGRCFYPFFDVALIVSLCLLCVVDGKPHEGVIPLLFGRCYCQCGRWKATVMNGRCLLPIVAGGIATKCGGRCCCQCGRLNGHICWNVSVWQMLLPLWQME